MASGLAALPEYELGEIAAEDLVTPVPLVVVNPEATEALKQKVGQQVLFVVRHSPQIADEAEADLRRTIAATRRSFILGVENALRGRSFIEAAADSPIYLRAIAEVSKQVPPELPLDQLARLWIRGASDAPLVETLAQPLREVMMQPIARDWTENARPPGEPIRLLAVTDFSEPPTAESLELPEQTVLPERIVSLVHARRLVAMRFPAEQNELGQFVASFVRANAVPDSSLTEILRARKIDGVAVNDSYGAGQLVVRKGRMIDGKALRALAAMREKSIIGVLQNKLDRDQTALGQISSQAKWIGLSLGAIGLALGLIIWRLRSRPTQTLVSLATVHSLPGWEAPALSARRYAGGAWERRALEAEHKVESVHAAIRSGVMAWMREKVFRKLTQHRSELLSVQQKAQLEIQALAQRLETLHAPLQERIAAYEQRIKDLERELAAKGEENRELIGTSIDLTRQQLKIERERRRFGSN